MAAGPMPIRRPASRTDSQQTRLGLWFRRADPCDAGDRNARAAKGPKAEPLSGDAFDGPVTCSTMLFRSFDRHLNRQAAFGLNTGAGGRVGAAPAYRDLLRHAMQVNGAFEECACCGVTSTGAKQGVDGVAVPAPPERARLALESR